MTELDRVGDQFRWFNGHGVLVMVADDKSWAEISFTRETPPHTWTKIMPLPLSPGAIPIDKETS